MSTKLPLACTLTTAEQTARRNQLTQTLFAQIEQVTELADGYQFHFPADDPTAEALLEFVKFERVCCAFIHFGLLFNPPQEQIILQLTGGVEVKTFIAQDLVGII